MLGVFWLFGLAFGFVLQRSRFRFASAFRDLFLLGDARMMKGVLAGLAMATAGFTVLMARLLPEVGFGSFRQGYRDTTGIHTLLGGCSSVSVWCWRVAAPLGACIRQARDMSDYAWNWWLEAHIRRHRRMVHCAAQGLKATGVSTFEKLNGGG